MKRFVSFLKSSVSKSSLGDFFVCIRKQISKMGCFVVDGTEKDRKSMLKQLIL